MVELHSWTGRGPDSPLLQQRVAVSGQQLGRLAGRLSHPGDGVVVDEATARLRRTHTHTRAGGSGTLLGLQPPAPAGVTHLVESSHEAGVVVEGRHDQGVVLLVHVQGGLHVHLGVLQAQSR